MDTVCYQTLEATLKNLNQLRIGEYNGAAGVLALLPTIGALLGAPTTEIWRLLTVLPFGGGLAMTLSFGGAILPVRLEDYENDLGGDKVAFKRNTAFRAREPKPNEDEKSEPKTRSDLLVEKIKTRMGQDESQRLAKGHLWLGLLGMILLSVGAQAAMIVVEQGGVLPWWCVSRWWMHLWYFLVTFTAIAENWAQLPFKETWKLFVSDVPYDVKILGGDEIITKFENPDSRLHQVLHNLASLKAGTAVLRGSQEKTQSRNTVLVMVSVVNRGKDRVGSLLRLLSKCTSIATFVTGTALFASVQLLALPIAVMTLTLVLAAGVFGRAITGWIVEGVSKTEPLIHEIVNTNEEAQEVIARILSLDEYTGADADDNVVRKIQVELGGHVFVSRRRVAHRSAWYLRTLGVLADPFDLRSVDMSKSLQNEGSPPSELEFGLLPR